MKFFVVNVTGVQGQSVCNTFFTFRGESEEAAKGWAVAEYLKGSDAKPIASVYAIDLTEQIRGIVGREWIEHFLPQILHGDEKHRSWLTEAFHAWQTGNPIPPPRGKGTDKDMSVCSSCGARYPSAPIGTHHKCGSCEDGVMERVS